MAQQSWYESFFPINPYLDDWSPIKNYMSLGFAPGYALQSRELLELQTIMMHQMSTTARTMFRHGQPRVDLEEESLTDTRFTSPVAVNPSTNTFSFIRNAQFFANFQLGASEAEVSKPNGFWLTFPPVKSNIYSEQLPNGNAPGLNDIVGFEIESLENIPGPEYVDYKTDPTLLDPAGNEFANSNAPGATRFAYRVKEQPDSSIDTPRYLTTRESAQGKRSIGEFFVPIAIFRNDTYFWAFDNTTPIRATN
tara:strand:+ start:2005 stop:2757 length:753 start_codon:yes stop_codon:yes gene_type:complete